MKLRSIDHPSAIAALVIASLAACAEPSGQSDTRSAAQAITGQWLLVPVDPYDNTKPLVGQDNWQLVDDPTACPNDCPDASPDVDPYPVENGYKHNNVIVLSNKRKRTSAIREVTVDPTVRFQNFQFQFKVSADTPADPEIKSTLVLADDDNAAIVKFRFNGLDITLCGSNYQEADCQSFFPNGVGDNGAVFQPIWYHIIVYLDQYVYNPTAYAEINVVGDPHIITRTNLVAIDSDPISNVAMYEFARYAGVIYLDYLLGYPKQ